MKSFYKITIAYLLIGIMVAFEIEYDIQGMLIFSGLGILWAVHVQMNIKKKDKIEWGNVCQPMAVIDWGLDGPKFELPEHLNGQYIPRAAKDVEETKNQIKALLSVSKNSLYMKKGLPVYEIYFRKGSRCNETQEEYIEYVIEIMNEQRVKWNKELDLKIPDYYRKAYLQAHRNGSLIS